MRLLDEIEAHGYVSLPEYRPSDTGPQAAVSLGAVMSFGKDTPVHPLSPCLKDDATPNTYSGIYGTEAFPFHTDLAHWTSPPRFLFLRCVKGFEQVPTYLLDSASLIATIGKDLLARALMRPRRPINGKLPLLRILRLQDDKPFLFRWDEIFLRPSGSIGCQAATSLRERIRDLEPINVPLVNTGDTLLVDNWRMLHSRGSVPPGCESRILQRAYLRELH